VANIQHSVLTDPNIHEPKGASSAAAGKVYVANGSGSGSWEYISGHAYGELYISNNSTAQTLAAASATSKLNPVGAWTANGNANVTLSAANGEMTLTQNGEYQLNFWLVFETAAISSGAAYNFYYAVNGTPSTRKVYAKKPTNNVDTIFLTASGISALSSTNIISIYVSGDGTSSNTNIIVKEAGFSAVLIDPS
jgi:hypothetical protein